LEKEHALHLALRSLIHSGVIKSAHDCSEGGLAVALAECCFSHNIGRDTPRLIGAQIDLGPPPAEQGVPASDNPSGSKAEAPSASPPDPFSNLRTDALLFGESQARIIISVSALNATKVLALAKILGVPARYLGIAGGNNLEIKTARETLSWPLREIHDLWWNAIGAAMRG
jgi:phosphoribosylformylglycinamidine synthase